MDFNDRLLADADKVNHYIQLQQHQISCQWKRIAQYLVFVGGNLALILVFWYLVKQWKLPAEAAYLTIGCLISGYGGYSLRTRLTAHEKRRPHNHKPDEPASSLSSVISIREAG